MKQRTVFRVPMPHAPRPTSRAIGLALLASIALWQAAEAVVSKLYSQNLVANSAVTGPSGVPANTLTHVVIDHANLVSLGKSRADGRDLLISVGGVPLALEVGAPAGMIGYHSFDASGLLVSPIPAHHIGFAVRPSQGIV